MLTESYVKAGNVVENKYSRLQVSIHWLVPSLVIAAYYAVKFRGFFSRSGRPFINMVHVSYGTSILVLMVVRLLLRLEYPTPPIIPKPRPMMTGLARLGHLMIYLLSTALSTVGLVMTYSWGNPWFAFDLTMLYASEANFEQVDSLKPQHEILVNLGYFVIGLHAAAALARHYSQKDNTPLRVIPRRRS